MAHIWHLWYSRNVFRKEENKGKNKKWGGGRKIRKEGESLFINSICSEERPFNPGHLPNHAQQFPSSFPPSFISSFFSFTYWSWRERKGREGGEREREKEREGERRREKEREREREKKLILLFHLFMHSLVTSSMCPGQRLNPQPWDTRTTL